MPKIKVWAGLAPSEAVRGNLHQVSPQAASGLLAISGIPRCITPTSAFTVTWCFPVNLSVSKFPLFIRTQSHWIRAHL